MKNTAPTFAATPQETRTCHIGNAMTDFCAIIQALKPLAYSEESGCARDYLFEKLEEVYHQLDELHRAGQVH